MAQFLIFRIYIRIPISPLVGGDQIELFWDDSTENIVVKLNDVVETSTFEIGVDGENWRCIHGSSSRTETQIISSYSFCDGSVLNWFNINKTFPAFPFADRRITTDSPVCDSGGGVVCDISFNGAPIISNATNLTSKNGQVVVNATSSNGTVKYGLTNFDYQTQGQTSGTFTGLSPGFYTIYAKDVNDCTAQIDFTILFQPEYTEHYRFSWQNISTGGGNIRYSRFRIYEREYYGDIVLLDNAGGSVLQMNKPKQGHINDKFYPIHPTSAVLTLMSEFDYRFLPLFTQDNKRFKCVYEIDEGSGFNIVWSGFIIPSVYRELFRATPYPVEFQISDNLITLKDELFTDDSGNLINGRLKLIKVLSLIFNKTGLQLNIQSGINIFEVNHNSDSTDDPLDQTYIDVSCYREEDGSPFSCWKVLESILRPFGARVLQEDNSWVIEEIDRATSSYAYRVFDYIGDYSSNSTFNTIVDIKSPDMQNRVALSDVDHSMEVIPAYGRINLTSNLNYIGSISTGGFEKNDLLSPESEVFDLNQGVFSSEEGFKDWTLRLNGTSGVNFGRVQLGTLGREVGQVKGERNRSVGAFYFNPRGGWAGNLRNAFIESAEKPYQYGPGDELKLTFEYSTPEKSEFEFMVLRFVLKVGSDYLQQDLSWSTTESIYRSYPKVSNSFQRFELSVLLPDTDVVIDTTVQLRIYFYSNHFFDYGIPSTTGSASGGTDGLSDANGLRTFVTDGVEYDYRADVRQEYSIGGNVRARRLFYELIVDAKTEDVPEIVRPDDYDGTNNPKIFRLLSSVVDNNEITNRNRGLDVKFYIDSVALDALINGQPPPKEEKLSLRINKYINEEYSIQLYNFDVPNITNAKNMYNNFFRLSDGEPTTLWARSGISEQLPLQQILLKVLGSNHSAPTFRITGTFINEFFRVRMTNYLRLTKNGSSLSITNTEFTSNLNSWSQTGTGETFVWTSDNSGSAQVTLNNNDDSKKIFQIITHDGGYILLTVNIHVEPSESSLREDVLWVVFYNGTSLTHMEKLKTFAAVSSTSDYNFTYTAFAPSHVTRIGFFFKNVTGEGTCIYQVGKFSVDTTDIEEVYQISDYSFDEKNDKYSLELMQLSKSYFSLQGTDFGGISQDNSDTGNAFDGAYDSSYGGDFDIILN